MVMKSSLDSRSVQRLLREHSGFWAHQLETHPDDLKWLNAAGNLDQTRSLRRLEFEWKGEGWDNLEWDQTLHALCRVKRREMLRITLRDLQNLGSLEEIVGELSVLADFCLQRALDRILKEQEVKHGKPQSEFAVFGMGKLGGNELNYSSDIDLIFAYSDEGKVGAITHHDYYTRVAQALVQGFRINCSEGSLFRIDLRLRPEGNAGPIVRSLEGYENYYAAFGEVWERMALQKARLVAGAAELGYEFIQHLQPFCFPKHLTPSALEEIYRIKGRIEAEILKEGGLERHVKLGRGGIREIEFAVQALQLLHGAKNAFSQERGTMRSLQALTRLDLLPKADAVTLSEAYIFLRRLEHRLQMREDRQTHVVPEDVETQTHLAKGLGFASHGEFETEWKKHVQRVRSFFDSIVGDSATGGAGVSIQDWTHRSVARDAVLRKAGFVHLEKAVEILRTLAEGPSYAHVSQRTRALFDQLCPHLLRLTPDLVRPDEVLQQLERFIEAYGPRAALYELLLSNPNVLKLLLRLFDRSPFLTDHIIRHPGMLESIAYEGLLQESHDRPRMEADLASETMEPMAARLRIFHRAELLRIGLRDILDLVSGPPEVWSEMSQLADICLDAAVREVFGKGVYKGTTSESFGVIAMGKYGGRELSYGSDLDVLFVGGSIAKAAQLVALMSKEQDEGMVFKVDARLRPDGEDGPLTLPLDAYRNYYAKRAQFWEKQALTRVRVAAGNPKLGAEFLKMVDEIIYAKPVSTKDLGELKVMRKRIEKERGDTTDEARNFKTGAGGLVDVEFLAQAQQLKFGHKHVELRRASTLEVVRTMPEIAGWKAVETRQLEEDYLWLRKLETVLRLFQNSSVSEMPASREEWEDVAKHLGLKNGKELEKISAERRKRIRAIYQSKMRESKKA